MMLGAGVAGIFALKKIPFNFLKSKIRKDSRITFTANPNAVKRNTMNRNRRMNG
jgi:hypothetical protein